MEGKILAKHILYLVERVKGRGPYFLYYYLTLRCNSKCRYCHVPKMEARGDADPREVVRNIHMARRAGITHLIFTGGEPLLYGDLGHVLSEARKVGFHTTVTTNGLLYPERAEEIKGLVDNLEFSLPAVDPEIYLRERGLDGAGKVVRAIERAVEIGERPVITATLTEENVSLIHELISFAESIGSLLLLKPAFDYFQNPSLSPSKAREIARYRHSKNVWFNMAFLKFFINGGNRVDRPKCRAIESTIAISPEGGIYLPCFHRSIELVPVGDDLIRAIRSPKVNEYRKSRGRWPFCQGCRVICYFEDAFLLPWDVLFMDDLMSRFRWIWRWIRLNHIS